MSARATDLDRAVARRLRERRIMLGLTQAELGRLGGVTYQQAHKYETGQNRLSVGRLIELAAALGTTAAEILQDLEPAGALRRQDYARHRDMLELSRNVAMLDRGVRQALAAFVRALVAREARL